jgi:hypothetical protein
MGWLVNATSWSLYLRERDPVPIVQMPMLQGSSLLPNPRTSGMYRCTRCHYRRWKFPASSLWVPKISHTSNSAKNCSEVHVVDSTDPLPGDRIAWNTILVCRLSSEQRPSAKLSPNVVRIPQPLHVLVQVTCIVWSQSDSVLAPSAAWERNSDNYSYVPCTLISINLRLCT